MDDENGRNRGHFSKYAGGPKSLKRHWLYFVENHHQRIVSCREGQIA
jgi:hypothetical protein